MYPNAIKSCGGGDSCPCAGSASFDNDSKVESSIGDNHACHYTPVHSDQEFIAIKFRLKLKDASRTQVEGKLR